MTPDDPRHGTYAGVSQHWKDGEPSCPPCDLAGHRRRKLNRYLQATGRPASMPVGGVIRRVEALQTLGWNVMEISRRSGVPWKTLRGLYRTAAVYRATFDAVAAVYDDLAMHAPVGPYATRAARRAQRLGFHPPEAWDDIDDSDEEPTTDHTGLVDEVIVGRLLAGILTPEATRPEREEAMRRHLADGGTDWTLAKKHGWPQHRYIPPELKEAG